MGKTEREMKMTNSFYSVEELDELGFAEIGENVLISRKTSIYGAKNIRIGNNVRIDDFCILSGRISIGNYVHIAVYSAIFGGESGVYIDDFSGISSRVTIYASSDDYSGEVLTNPTVPSKYTGVYSEKVMINKHVIVGATSVILPGAILNEGVACGACSLIKGELEGWTIYTGIPAKKKKARSKKLLEYEKKLKSEIQG